VENGSNIESRTRNSDKFCLTPTSALKGRDVLDAVYTRGESPQDRLGDVWTCRITLASAYVLCHLSTA